MKSLCPGVQLSDAADDFCGAARVAQFRVSEKAFYLPAFPGTRYIPFEALTRVVLYNASLSTIGCCGKELPVLKLILRWDDGEKAFVIDPPKHADTILNQIKTARPELDVEDRRYNTKQEERNHENSRNRQQLFQRCYSLSAPDRP